MAEAAAATVKQIAEKDFECSIAGEKPVLVDFFATWCGPCKTLAPKLEEMAKEYTNIVFLKVDVDECEELTTQHKVTAMPTLILFKGGKEIGRVVGAQEDAVKKLLEANK